MYLSQPYHKFPSPADDSEWIVKLFTSYLHYSGCDTSRKGGTTYLVHRLHQLLENRKLHKRKDATFN